ncbi:MAG TPA: RIP metalloprotease RseP [Flavobacteriaceae bacterium]|nr:RIP metalloprotease RseP [Flavobacteriaceae bacterium]
MTPFAVKAIQLLLSLSILIVLHELGHFIPARIFKTRVEKFYLFFDVKFSLFKKKIGETVYGIGWLPLGGYVKIAGMIDESMDKEQMAKPPQPWEFRSKPTWQRLIIMLGGVTMNIIVALIIYASIIYFNGRDVIKNENLPNGLAVAELMQDYGFQNGDKIVSVNGKELVDVMEINRYLLLRNVKEVQVLHQSGDIETLAIPDDIGHKLFAANALQPFVPRIPAVIDTVLADYPAASGGIKKGDVVKEINNTPIQFWDEVRSNTMKGEVNSLLVSRDGKDVNLTIDLAGQDTFGIYSFGLDTLEKAISNETYGIGESITGGISMGLNNLRDYGNQFKYVFTKKGATQVGGFGAIGNMFPDTWNWLVFWERTALISIMLAFMNILPIPALDGGHVVFLLYEMVSGRKPNEKVLEYAQMIGFFILIALVLYANGNDIYKWLTKAG